jgi:hypothetical protein
MVFEFFFKKNKLHEARALKINTPIGACIATNTEFCGAHVHTSRSVQLQSAGGSLAAELTLCVGIFITLSILLSPLYLRLEATNFGRN